MPLRPRSLATYQQFVAGRVTERVVDVLEVVEIDEDQRRFAAGGFDVGDGFDKTLHHLAAIGQTRERVVHGQVMGACLGALQGTHVNLAHQYRVVAGGRVATTPCRDFVPTLALRGVNGQRQRGGALVVQRLRQTRLGVAIDHPQRQALVERAYRFARRRVAVRRLAVTVVERDHRRGVQQCLRREHQPEQQHHGADHRGHLGQGAQCAGFAFGLIDVDLDRADRVATRVETVGQVDLGVHRRAFAHARPRPGGRGRD